MGRSAEEIGFAAAKGRTVCVGDTVVDPLDGARREVIRIEDETLFMADGGCMGINEVTEIILESEAR